MDDFDFEDWFTGSSYVDPGIPVSLSDISVSDLGLGSIDLADAFNFGDLSSVLDLGNVDFSDAISFGDLSGITGGIEGFGDVADIIGQGAAGIPGIEGFGDIADIVGQGAAGIPGIEGFGDIADVVGQGAAGIKGIEGFGDVADVVGQGTTGITGIEGFGSVADEVGQGATGITGIEGFGAAADEVGQGSMGIPGIEGFGATADEVGQGSNLGRDPFEVDGAQGSRTEQTALTGTTPGGSEVIKTTPPKTEPTKTEPTKTTTPDKSIIDRIFGTTGKDSALLMALLGGLLGLLGKGSAPKLPVGYQGGIPKYKSIRGEAMSPTAGGRRPGGANIPSLTGGYTLTKAAGGGLMDLAQGGRPARYLRGGTDGMADEIKTDIDGKQPARLSHGEFVIPADVVSHLGNGNSDAGADVLYDMMAKVRKARTGTTKQGKQINPRKMIPA